MTLTLAVILSAALCYAGMAGLCLAMDRHHSQVWKAKAPNRQRLLRVAGWLLLALAVWPCVLIWDGAVGPVVWCGMLSVGAFVLVLLLPYRPRIAALLAAVAAGAGLPVLLLTAG
jgi:hypothetical protein